MAKLSRNFIKGKMNKSLTKRLIPNGEYIDALNIVVGSTEGSDVGSIENTKGNSKVTNISYNGQPLSSDARTIGALEDGANETLYWFVHDSNFTSSPTGKLDLLMSFNNKTNVLTYHLVSIDDGGNSNTTLNFTSDNLITGVNIIDDLLYWTDNYNPPRYINVKDNYADPSGSVDGFSAKDLMVLKQPPVNTPLINPIKTSSEENFLEDRFVSFAYRYRYKDNKYSATSQWSSPSFSPGVFRYDYATGLNTGMLNTRNTCVIDYNSGDSSVVGIDLLWKDMEFGSIRVIEKLDKESLGLSDNTNYSYTFDNSKIFTILPDSEILRLYDNVPRLAKAQTVMGNRLTYGNYLEGYNLELLNGEPVRLEYTAELNSIPVGVEDIPDTLDSSDYNYNTLTSVSNSEFVIDLAGIDLIAGSVIEFNFVFAHQAFNGDTTPTETTTDKQINFQYILPQDFNSVYDLATSIDFRSKIGVASNIKPFLYSCEGTTLTDLFNCIIPNTLDSLFKYDSGIDNGGEPIKITASTALTTIGFQLPAVRFVDDQSGASITQNAYEYYSVSSSSFIYQSQSNPKSLHSNISYEVGIIYMDDFGRSTTALVSEDNTVHVPCSLSDFANRLRVNIPKQQLAPYWAKRYKFALKPSKETGFVVYSNFFFRDPTTNSNYFLLEGENSRKIEEGDLLRVKADANGALNRCVYANVLEKKAQERDFLSPPPIDAQGSEIPVPAGVYMKVNTNQFSTTIGDLPVVAPGSISENKPGCNTIYYPVDVEDSNTPGSYVDYTIPEGSKIRIEIKNERKGNIEKLFGNVSKLLWEVESTFTASKDYTNFQDWFDGDNIFSALEALAVTDGTGVEADYNIVNSDAGNIVCSSGNIYFRFFTSGGRKYLSIKGFQGYNGSSKLATLTVNIEVIRSNSLIVFETELQDSSPDIWYESSESYLIDQVNGRHNGNVQNQTTTDPAIIDTSFFNCYAFGNGVESSQVRDSLVGKKIVLGNRVTSTSDEDYREVRRYSDLTYSGVYNDQSNVNKLNEFNLGLLNYKALERSHGSIQLIDGRATDILVLKEDRITYVLSGKNLLSDAVGGGVVSSVPEVLGTEISRVEEFGISFNPESYCKWGFSKYFTDAKRGAVLMLEGNSATNERLVIISDYGMNTWFRDLFLDNFNTQKLGGYDPYRREYVLSSNQQSLPVVEDCIDCGLARTILVTSESSSNYCVDVGKLVGNVEVTFSVAAGGDPVNFDAVYNGVGSPVLGSSGIINISKDSVFEDTIDISISSTGTSEVTVNVSCPESQEITVIQVALTNDSDSGKFIHNEYRWVDGNFVSPLKSNLVEFVEGTDNPLVSQYESVVGFQGAGFVPADGATVSIISNKKTPSDDYDFEVGQDSFSYLRTDTLYNNNETDIAALLAASSLATPISGSGNTYEASFTMPSTNEQYLYLIYNYRNSTALSLCYSAVDANDACCNCVGA